MRRRELLILLTLVAFAMISANGNPLSVSSDAFRDEQMPASEVDSRNDAEVRPIETLPVESSPSVSNDKALISAYLNTLSILSTNNACSLFFGGSAGSVDVFKHLIGKVQKEYFTTPIGIQMSGDAINVSNAVTGTEYRLFNKVVINTQGPFYRRRFAVSGVPLPLIGTFEPSTKEVRVLMLLHELGHVMKGEDGNWLLPDDGKDDRLSRLNSKKIASVCGKQIKALRKHEDKGSAKEAANTVRED